MKCKEVLSVLSRYQDNECDKDSAAKIHLHLQNCQRCRLEFNQMNQTMEKMKDIKEVEPSLNFTATVMKNIREQKRFHLMPFPSLVYSFIFILFFILGIFLTLPLTPDKVAEKKEATLVQLLMESQNLNHFSTQNKAIQLLHSGENHEK